MKKRLIRFIIASCLVLAVAFTAFRAVTRDTLWADLTGAEPTFHESWTESDRAHIRQMLAELQSPKKWSPESDLGLELRGVVRHLARTEDVNARGSMDTTPLHAALYCKDLPFAKTLAERGADVNAVNRIARITEEGILAPFQERTETFQHETPLGLACKISKSNAPGIAPEERIALVRLLLDLGANPDIESDGQLPLEIACFQMRRETDAGSEAIAGLLLDHGADCLKPHQVEAFGISLGSCGRLIFGVWSGSPAIVSRMLAAGCDPNGDDTAKVSHQGMPPITLIQIYPSKPGFSHHKPVEILQILLKHGAQATRKNDEDGATALHRFCANSCANIWSGSPATYDASMCKTRHELAQLLLSQGADPNIQDNEGNTPLMNIDAKGGTGYTTGPHGTALVQLLIDHGADLSLRNKAGEDAIAVHERLEHPDIVKTLKAAKAKPASGK